MRHPAGPWDADRLRSFLDATIVPIRLSCRLPDGELWMVSLWYAFEDGRFHCATSAGADVVGFLRSDDRVAFEVSTNEPPYAGVRGNGTARMSPDEDKRRLRSLIDRYLGDRQSTLARTLLRPGRDEVQITIEPRRLYTWDFTERMADVDATRSGE
ncbi:MAG: pyridoxamine 5'-phosphate oxidase family protein [Halobacteriota archaeon]